MRITLLTIGVISLLCSGCQTRSTATSTSPVAPKAVPSVAAVAGPDIFGGYVGQEVANGISHETQEELISEFEKFEEQRLYQYWKKKRMKF